jgi:hypothetical protein
MVNGIQIAIGMFGRMPQSECISSMAARRDDQMPYGLNKATNYYNKIEAWKDWEKAYTLAQSLGLQNVADSFRPFPYWPWKKIDARTAKLKTIIEISRTI